MKINEILAKYTLGEATLEETNAALKEAGANFHLNPNKNILTPDEIANHSAGLLDTGLGSYDKVYIKDGHITNCDCGDMKAFVFVGGKVHEVKGTEIIGL